VSAPTISLDALTRNLQNVKDKHADQIAKNMGHRTASNVASVDLPCMETPHFRKCIYMQDCYKVNKQNTHTSLLLL
jgi:hypothetical protein